MHSMRHANSMHSTLFGARLDSVVATRGKILSFRRKQAARLGRQREALGPKRRVHWLGPGGYVPTVSSGSCRSQVNGVSITHNRVRAGSGDRRHLSGNQINKCGLGDAAAVATAYTFVAG
jgi:hypothetical protein